MKRKDEIDKTSDKELDEMVYVLLCILIILSWLQDTLNRLPPIRPELSHMDFKSRCKYYVNRATELAGTCFLRIISYYHREH